VTVEHVIDQLSASGSTWTRGDILRAICDLQPAVSQMAAHRWAAALERACDQVIDHCVDLDPVGERARRRASDGRSIWLEPTAAHFTSDTILAEEERVLSWAMDAQTGDPRPSLTVDRYGLDLLQADAAAAVAGTDRLVVVVGPAGTGKTTALQRAVDDLTASRRPVFGVAPTAKAARVLEHETGTEGDTVAKLLHEWKRADRPPLARYRLSAGTTLIVDEAGMIGTASLHQLVGLAEARGWRLALVGDPRQLQAVGRGGLFNELCSITRVHELSRIRRFTQHWEAAASLRLRAGDLGAFGAYGAHDRITGGPFDEHIDRIAKDWLGLNAAGHSVAITATTNQHVDAVNHAVQDVRLTVGQLDPDAVVRIAGGEHAYAGEVIATRHNDRELRTSLGQPVRNRDLWTVTATDRSGGLTVSHLGGHGTLTLPADYVQQHVRLGYAATEHAHQGDTVDVGITLVSTATTHRGLYVGVTRGRDQNQIHVVTDSTDPADARDVLDLSLTLPASPNRSRVRERPGVTSWGDAQARCEVSVQMALIDEPGHGGHLCSAPPGLEKASGLHHPLADLERVRRDTGDRSELPDEVEFRRTGSTGEVIERHVDREVVLQVLHRGANGAQVGPPGRLDVSGR
jgi:AAA domain